MLTDAMFAKFTSIPWLGARTILLTKHGSHAYGTALPTSDLDVKGVAIPPRHYFTGFRHRFEQAESRGEPDLVVYDIRKFFTLAADCNPNIIEVLWTDPADHMLLTGAGEALVERRALFLSRKAKHTFSGYAMAQLKRIKTHRRWLLSPPTHEPTREEFGLAQSRPVAKEQLGAADAAIRREMGADRDSAVSPDLQGHTARRLGYDDNFIEYLQCEQAYATKRREWDQFQTWKAERNEARARLEAEHGYDTKHAMHLVRLMRMCREILSEGVVRVRRHDAEELLSIRRGAWTYDRLMEWAGAENVALGEVAEQSPLPHAPDLVALDKLCCMLVEDGVY